MEEDKIKETMIEEARMKGDRIEEEKMEEDRLEEDTRIKVEGGDNSKKFDFRHATYESENLFCTFFNTPIHAD